MLPGGFHAINSDPNISRLHAYGISVYKEVEEISGQDTGMHLVGGIQVAASGAVCAIGVRSTHYEQAGFGEKLSVDVANGIITEPKLVKVNMYSAQPDNPEHANDKYLIVQCQLV